MRISDWSSDVCSSDLSNRLNERQKECLRLFYANLEVKEIASEIGLSPNTVKKYLLDARRTLGVSRSMQAARILVEYERDTRGVPQIGRASFRERGYQYV